MVGILVPMPEEIDLLLSQMQVENVVEAGMRQYYVGTINDKKVVVALSRIGKVASAVTASYLITHFPITQLIVAGVAGGADDKLNIGDVCIATQCIQHDMDASGLFPKFEIPLLGVKYFPSMPLIIEKAELAIFKYLLNGFFNQIHGNIRNEFLLNDIKVHQGVMASGDQFIASAMKLAEIKKGIPELLFVEMEGAAVAQVCYEYKIPLLNIRIISDKANDTAAVDFQKFIDNVAKFMILGVVTQYLDEI